MMNVMDMLLYLILLVAIVAIARHTWREFKTWASRNFNPDLPGFRSR